MEDANYENVVSVTAATRAAMDVLGWGRNECVVACRASLELGRRLGWRARPLTVAAYVTRPDVPVASGTHGTGSLNFTETVTSRSDGLFDTTWDGHLLTLFEQRWAADVTADQFSRPDHQLVINSPVVVELGDGQRPSQGSWFGAEDPNTGLTITYRVVADELVWGREYWWNADYWEPVVEAAMTILDIE